MKLPLLATITLFACTASTISAAEPGAAKTIGLDLSLRNMTVKPGDDFEEYANGGWRKTTEIPPDRSSVGVTYDVFKKAEKRNADLISGLKPKEGPLPALIANYYAAFMDTDTIAKRGLDPLKTPLVEIEKIESKTDLARALGQQLRADVDPLNATNMWTENLFGLFVAQALNDPSRNVPYLLQGGLGMPDREYYVSDDAEMKTIRAAYQTYVADLLKVAGIADPAAKAERIMALETKMATAHLDRTASSDVHKANNPISTADLEKLAPGLDWKTYLTAAGLEKQPTFILWQRDAIKGLAALVESEPLGTWKEWMTFHLLNQSASYLAPALDDLHFGFYGKTLQGTPQQRDRWKRAVGAVNNDLGDAVGKIYVERYFPPSSKAEVQSIAKNVIAAFDKRIDILEWMAPATKKQAHEKIKTLRVGVGYPETWRSYDGLVIRPDDAIGNAVRAKEWEYHHQMAKLGQPPDKDEWWMTPQTVNAVNLPLQNAMNFPAAYLEAPYFDPKADAAANYASIGATIGHEISHSFDNLGAEFNAEGKLENWWTPEDQAHFKEASRKLADQFSAYEPLPGLHINGDLTLGENIADVAGLAAAYDAYKLSLNGKPLPVVEKLTGDQRFFLAYAQSWRKKVREAALRQQVITNEHAPDRERAQTVRNLDGWYEAWGAKPGDKLYLAPADRVRLW